MDSSSRGCRDESSSRASSAGGRRATRELFLCSTATVRRRNESDDDFLARVTHLRLHNKGISTLDNANVFDACPSLKVLYLYDNCVESLKGLEMLQQMEQLFVDNNLLATVQGTLPCKRLTKLHLSGNNILMLSGLESAVCLEELHVAKQRLPRGQRFAIDQASINGIKDSLMVLDASGNSMGGTEIEPLLDLDRLETLNLADNDIKEMAQVVDLVSTLEMLRIIDLRGNAVSRMAKYFERTVTRCGETLTTLDGKPVHTQHRLMLQRLDRHKRAEARKSASKALASSTTHAPMAESGVPVEVLQEVDDKALVQNRRRQDPATGAWVGNRSSHTGVHSGHDQPFISWPG